MDDRPLGTFGRLVTEVDVVVLPFVDRVLGTLSDLATTDFCSVACIDSSVCNIVMGAELGGTDCTLAEPPKEGP